MVCENCLGSGQLMPYSIVMIEEKIAIGIFVAVNILAVLIVGNDKHKSMNRGNSERTPEGILFFIAACFGSIGVYAGMLAFRHKTQKWYFVIGIPFLIFQNLASLYLLRELLIRFLGV